MKKLYIPFLTAVLVLGGVLPFLAPPAAAQVSANANADGGGDVAVTPLGQPISTTIRVTVTVSTAGLQPLETIPVEAQVTNPAGWLAVSVSPRVRFFNVPASAASGSETIGPLDYTVTFSASQQAPALDPEVVIVDFVERAEGAVSDVNFASTPVEFTVVAKYFSILSFRTPSTFQRVGPTDSASFPVSVVNGGNGPTLHTFEITQIGNERWQVPVPAQVEVPATQTGSESNEAPVTLQVSSELSTGWYNDLGVVTMKISPFYAPNRAEGEGVPTSVSFVAHFQGMYVPGFGAIGALLALGLIGATAKTTRKE